ncbi:Uncharacterized protein Rs2_34536 [Raphanus sativus]|nr:Uncharacterized protein Rs2_34536 [Raphanus sativus]
MSEIIYSFEKQFVNMEVQAEFMENAMAGSTSLSTPEGEVNSLMQQVADDYGLEIYVGLPQPAGHAIPTATEEKVDEDDLSRRLAELKAEDELENQQPYALDYLPSRTRMYLEAASRKAPSKAPSSVLPTTCISEFRQKNQRNNGDTVPWVIIHRPSSHMRLVKSHRDPPSRKLTPWTNPTKKPSTVEYHYVKFFLCKHMKLECNCLYHQHIMKDSMQHLLADNLY